MAFRDLAIADYQAAKAAADAAAAAAEAAARTALVDKAKVTLTPVLTDRTGKLAYDTKLLTAPHVDVANDLVILKADTTHFAVQAGAVKLAHGSGTAWSAPGPVLKTLADAGAALAAAP